MHPSDSLVLPIPYSIRATTTSSHPQLRDLVVFTPQAEGGNAVTTVCYDSLCSVDLWGARPPEYTPLRFSPATVAYGMGLVAAGGQASEIALKSAAPEADWLHQYLPASSPPSSTGVRSVNGGSINNSIFICPSPSSASKPRLLVSNNDEKIAVYEVAGRVPDWQAARRRRKKERKAGWSVVEASWAAERGEKAYGRRGGGEAEDSEVEERPSYDEEGEECTLVPLPHEDIRLRTAVNHCSVSPDGRRMVAVGDTNEVFLYDCHGFVHVYDTRSLPSSSSSHTSTSAPRKLAELKTSQAGPAGAARKVKFSPGGARLDAGLLAFTEHRNRVHVVDARTFESYQVLDVPAASPAIPGDVSLPSPPPLRPRPQPPPRIYRPAFSRVASIASSLGGGSGTRTPKDEIEREELEREMRERTERRLREEDERIREQARDERRAALVARARRVVENDDDAAESDESEEEEVEDYTVGYEGEGPTYDYEEEEEEQEEGEMMEEDPIHRTEVLDISDSESSTLSVDTTRPRRFEGGEARRDVATSTSEPAQVRDLNPPARSTRLRESGPRSFNLVEPSLAARVAGRYPSAQSTVSAPSPPPVPASPPPVRRNYTPSSLDGYTALAPSSRSSAPSYTYATPTTFATSTRASTSSSGNFYYSTYVPSSFPTSLTTSSRLSLPSLFTLAGGAHHTTYQATSAFFPLDSAPGDLLGLAWDEWGERVIVATGERVWEWDVDVRARRGRGDWGVR
ncbi:hypothetical protein JCM10213v2_006575 [Rhodosporidiobolus nylandii]